MAHSSYHLKSYADDLEAIYDKTPKAVFAAIAWSLAERISPGRAPARVLAERGALHLTRIVQHRPPRRTRVVAADSIVATPGALDALMRAGETPVTFLRRHVLGDWGDLDDDD